MSKLDGTAEASDEALRRYLAGALRAPAPTGALALGVEMARSAAGFARSRLA